MNDIFTGEKLYKNSGMNFYHLKSLSSFFLKTLVPYVFTQRFNFDKQDLNKYYHNL